MPLTVENSDAIGVRNLLPGCSLVMNFLLQRQLLCISI